MSIITAALTYQYYVRATLHTCLLRNLLSLAPDLLNCLVLNLHTMSALEMRAGMKGGASSDQVELNLYLLYFDSNESELYFVLRTGYLLTQRTTQSLRTLRSSPKVNRPNELCFVLSCLYSPFHIVSLHCSFLSPIGSIRIRKAVKLTLSYSPPCS